MKSSFAVFFVLLFFSHLSTARNLFENSMNKDTEPENRNLPQLQGYVRASAYGGSERFDFSSVFGETAFQTGFKKGNLFLFSEIRVISGLAFNETFTSLDLREAMAGYTSEKLDIIAGNQIVTWGRTDGFNPTSNISPFNYFFLSADPDDQKLSNFMLRMRYRFAGRFDLELIGIPVYKSSVYRYELFGFGENASFGPPSVPDQKLKNGTVAVRLNYDAPSIGFSLSWFRGFDPFFGFDIKKIDWTTGNPVIDYTTTPYLKNCIGADFAFPLGKWIIRGEAAINAVNDYKTNIYIPNPDFAWVFNVEKSLSGFTFLFQYIGKTTFDFQVLNVPVLTDPQNPMAQMQYAGEVIRYESEMFNRKLFHQQEKNNHALFFSANKSFAWDTWNAECSAWYNLTSEEYFIRPKISWKITDGLSLCLGASVMKGPEKSIFDYAGPVLNGGFMELKAHF